MIHENRRCHTSHACRQGQIACCVAVAALAMLPCGCIPGVQPPPVDTAIELELVAEGFVSPVGMEVPPDGSGRIFILDQVGQVRVIDSDGTLRPDPFLDLAPKLPAPNAAFDERGLLGLAFHPSYATNGRFFVRYSVPRAGDPSESCNDPEGFIVGCHSEVLAEFQVSADDANRADADSEIVLLSVDKPQFNHNGGKIAFGPDGFLYVGLGDGGGANDNEEGHNPETGNGQDKSTILGKILRIDVDSGDLYGIPADNPFVDDENARPEIWALGLRNPWRFSFDVSGERRLFLGDAGQDLFEEINIIERGANYGWNIREGFHCFDPDAPTNPPTACPDTDADNKPLIDPILEYSHADEQGEPFGIAAVGGHVYRGSAIPSLQGKYIFGDYSSRFDAASGRLFAATEDVDGSWTMTDLTIADTGSSGLGRYVLSFGQNADGEVYVLTTQSSGPTGTTGRVFKIVPVHVTEMEH